MHVRSLLRGLLVFFVYPVKDEERQCLHLPQVLNLQIGDTDQAEWQVGIKV